MEEDSVSEVLSFDDAEEDGSEQSLSIDIEDLFADDSSETDAEEVKGDD